MNSPSKSLSGLIPFIHPYRFQVACAGLFLIFAACTTLVFPFVLRNLIDQGLGVASDENVLSVQFFELFLVTLALAVFSALRFYLVSWLGEKITNDVKNSVYAHVLRQSPTFFETTQSGDVLSRLTNDATLVHSVVGSSLSMGLRNVVMALGAIAMLIWTNPLMMVQVIGALSLVVLPSIYLGHRVRRLSRATQDRAANSSALASEVLNAISVVQSYNAERREADRYASSNAQGLVIALKRTQSRSLLVGFIIMASSAALLWGLYLGTLSVLAGTTTAGELGQTVLYVIFLSSSIAVLGEVYGDVLRAAGATERLMELLHTSLNLQSPESPQQALWPQSGSRLLFRSVNFHYPSRPNQLTLNGLSGEVRAGQTVAIVGPSGAGKSTLFSLLLRFYSPQQGEIWLDGGLIEKMKLNDLRERIGIVPQEPVVFSGTVMDNIRYGKTEATDREVFAAADVAYANEFIADLPLGFDTYLGDRGVRLSGGQRQRIAIARAILKNPPLLLLDEATSALDANSERMVQTALDKAMKGRTTLVIAHRLATVQRADCIWVLDRGCLVEQGTHAELIAKKGLYANLAALQFRDFER